jgi:Protein of unknown function (DUF2946)
MSRFIALLLALLLPLQLAWGAAASHCQHETEPQALQHFGHHEHIHQSDAHKAPAGNNLVADNDCGFCHATEAAAVLEATPSNVASIADARVAVPAQQRPASALARAPDRPQWPRLA